MSSIYTFGRNFPYNRYIYRCDPNTAHYMQSKNHLYNNFSPIPAHTTLYPNNKLPVNNEMKNGENTDLENTDRYCLVWSPNI